MTIKRWCLFAVTVAMLSALAATTSVSAQDDPKAHSIDTRVPSIASGGIGQADGDQTAQTQEDDSSRVTDLESTRAALDRRSGPTVSLSVSGWVAEQAIRTH